MISDTFLNHQITKIVSNKLCEVTEGKYLYWLSFKNGLRLEHFQNNRKDLFMMKYWIISNSINDNNNLNNDSIKALRVVQGSDVLASPYHGSDSYIRYINDCTLRMKVHMVSWIKKTAELCNSQRHTSPASMWVYCIDISIYYSGG